MLRSHIFGRGVADGCSDADGANNTSTLNAIPIMTSNTAPSGIASASSIYATSHDAYKAMDDDIVLSYWITQVGVVAGWLAYEFPVGTVINKYVIGIDNSISLRAPKDWTFEGWNGTTWDVLSTVAGETLWAQSVGMEYRTFTCVNNTDYTKYRVNITANNGDSYLAIFALEMIECTA